MPHSGLKPKIENDPKEEDDLRWKTVLDGGRPLKEDDLWQKTTFDRKRPLTEDDLDRRRPLTEDDLFSRLVTLTATAQLTPNQKSYQLYKPEKEFLVMEEMYAASCMHMCAEKTTFVGKEG